MKVHAKIDRPKRYATARSVVVAGLFAAVLPVTASASAPTAVAGDGRWAPLAEAAAEACASSGCLGWATFPSSLLGASVLVRRSGDSTVQLTLAGDGNDVIVETLEIVGTTVHCGQAHDAARRVFAARLVQEMTDHFVVDVAGDLHEPLSRLDSVRLRVRTSEGEMVRGCARAFVATRVDASMADTAEGAYARLDTPAIAGLATLRLTDTIGEARLSIEIVGLTPERRHVVFGSEAPCGMQHDEADPGFLLRFRSGADGGRSAFVAVDVDPGDALTKLRSIRVVRGIETDGAAVACVRARLVRLIAIDVWEHA